MSNIISFNAAVHARANRATLPSGLRPVGMRHSRGEPLSSPRVVCVNRAVLIVDIVESVRLVERDQWGVITRWLAFMEHVRLQVLGPGEGRLVKSLGDGMLLSFTDVHAAVAAAFAIEAANARQNAGLPADRQILLRMGLEVCDVILEGNDVYGHGVNLAARLLTLCGPGEIVVSKNVRDRLGSALEADDLGDCHLRHVSQPVRAYKISAPLSAASSPLRWDGTMRLDLSPSTSMTGS